MGAEKMMISQKILWPIPTGKAEKTFNVSPYQYNENKDFRINNQVGTFVLRWEYLPGSLIYAVYKLQDNNYYSYEELSWSRSKSNSFFLKVDYFFQY